jgi:diaminopimelate decarboxylase
LNAAAIVDAQNKTVDLAIRLCDQLALRIDWLNIGGGFGVPYFPGERALDVAAIADNLARLAALAQDQLGVPLKLELGRYLIAEAGVYVCRVVDVKDSHGQRFVIADGGLNHNLAASGNLGQVIRKNYPVAIANRIDQPSAATQTINGPLCTPLDLLADKMDLPLAQPGDLIAVFLAGAYGPSASPLGFLSHPQPLELLV